MMKKTTMMKCGMNRAIRMAAIVGAATLLSVSYSDGAVKRPKINQMSSKSHQEHSMSAPKNESELSNSLYSYPLDTCIVSGEKIGTMGKAVIYDYEGREIRFCCPACVEKFQKSPEEYLKKIDAAILQQQLPIYPIDVCPVTGNKLGEIGEPVNIVYKNRLIRLCCNGCIKAFDQLPAPFLEKLDKTLITKQKAAYALKNCAVSGKKLGSMGEPVDILVGNQLVRLCCDACKATLQKEPAKYLELVAPPRAATDKAEPMPKETHPESEQHDHSGHQH